MPEALPGFPPLGESVIIAADTVVALEGVIFGKPRNPAEALCFLQALVGTTHEVLTGCAVLYKGEMTSFFARTAVTFWNCPTPLLAAYAATDEVLDKAGAYAIQGNGAFLVEKIEGSFTNVVGLPVAELAAALLEKGIASPCGVS